MVKVAKAYIDSTDKDTAESLNNDARFSGVITLPLFRLCLDTDSKLCRGRMAPSCDFKKIRIWIRGIVKRLSGYFLPRSPLSVHESHAPGTSHDFETLPGQSARLEDSDHCDYGYLRTDKCVFDSHMCTSNVSLENGNLRACRVGPGDGVGIVLSSKSLSSGSGSYTLVVLVGKCTHKFTGVGIARKGAM